MRRVVEKRFIEKGSLGLTKRSMSLLAYHGEEQRGRSVDLVLKVSGW